MIEKQTSKRKAASILDIDTMVPKTHPLRQVDAAVDWNQIYGLAETNYSKGMGRPGVDPVVLVKIAFLKQYYEYLSLRQTLEDVQINLAYRWFLGFGFLEKPPHPSTVSRNLKQRFDAKDLEDLFAEIFEKVAPMKKKAIPS